MSIFWCTLRRFTIKILKGVGAMVASIMFWLGVAWISLDFWPDWNAIRPYLVVGCTSMLLLVGIIAAWLEANAECKKEREK